MSSNTNRCIFWKIIGLNSKKAESIFYQAKHNAQNVKVSSEERAEWTEKTNRLMSLFDYYDIPRPIHGKNGFPSLSSLAGYAAIVDALETIEIPFIGDSRGGLTKNNILEGFNKLGEKAILQGVTIKIMAVGGAALVLGYSIKRLTHDVDVYIIAPENRKIVREMASQIAEENGWEKEWLNEGAKGFIMGSSYGSLIYSSIGIEVYLPSPYQLLAMKLTAWRSVKDEMDASVILQSLIKNEIKDKFKIWDTMESYIPKHSLLKAKYAFDDCWETLHGNY
jgi:hypothetical protein